MSSLIMMATAFCPAHITGFFKAELDKEDSYAAKNCFLISSAASGFFSFSFTNIEFDSLGLSTKLRKVSMWTITLVSNP